MHSLYGEKIKQTNNKDFDIEKFFLVFFFTILELLIDVPHIAFHGFSFFSNVISSVISRLKLHHVISDDQEPFLVPGLIK